MSISNFISNWCAPFLPFASSGSYSEIQNEINAKLKPSIHSEKNPTKARTKQKYLYVYMN